MKRILIVQTTRMGDALQTSPLIRRLRLRWPDAHITALVRRMGKTIVERHPDVNEVITYDEDEMFLDLTSRDSERLLKAYYSADARIRQLKAGRYDVAYNVTHSLASAMLMRLADIPEVVGADMSEDWQFILRGPWASYFFTGVLSREYNDLNLCDIWRHFADADRACDRLVFEVRDEDREAVNALLESHGIGRDDFIVCFQLGASETGKRWAPERFAGLAQMLRAKRNASILLVGVTEEAPLGDAMLTAAPDSAIPLYGKTSVPQLAALLERAGALISNDTGTMHVAAAVGCPITLVSIGHVHYRETGPWGEGHCAIERRREQLGRSDFVPGAGEEPRLITSEQVMTAVDAALRSHEQFPCGQIPDSQALHDVDIFISRFAPDGCLQFYPVVRRSLTERDLMRAAYRCMWLEHLRRRHDARTESESLRLLLGLYDGPHPDIVFAWAAEKERAFSSLAEHALQGIHLANALLDALKKGKGLDKAKSLAAELTAIDEHIRVCGEVYAECKPITLLARFERDNLEGADPVALAKATKTIYQGCYSRSGMMRKKLKRIAKYFATLNATNNE